MGPWTREHDAGRWSGGEPGRLLGLGPTARRRRIDVEDPPNEDRRRNPLPPVCGRRRRVGVAHAILAGDLDVIGDHHEERVKHRAESSVCVEYKEG